MLGNHVMQFKVWFTLQIFSLNILLLKVISIDFYLQYSRNVLNIKMYDFQRKTAFLNIHVIQIYRLKFQSQNNIIIIIFYILK